MKTITIPKEVMEAITRDIFAILPKIEREMYDFGRKYETGRNGIQIDTDFNEWEQSLIDDALKNFKGQDFSEWKLDRYYNRREYGICMHDEKTIKVRELRGFNEVDHFEFTAVHEFRHAMQHATGNLTISEDQTSMTWKPTGEVFKVGVPITRDEYFNLPWERDANGYAFSCVDVKIYDRTLYKCRETAKILF